MISLLLTTAWAVFYTWLGREGWSRDQLPSNYDMGHLLYLAGPSSIPGWAGWAGHVISLLLTTAWAVFYTWLGREGWSRDQLPSNYDMGHLLYLAGPDGSSSIPCWAGWVVFYT